VQHGNGENGEVLRCGEQASVSGNASEDARIFILDFTLDDAMAKGFVIGCRWDLGAKCRRGIERGVGQAEGTEDFALAETAEGLIGEALERDPEDEAAQAFRAA